MDPATLLVGITTQLGYGAYVPVVLSGIGFFSVIASFYPPTWKGAYTIHKLALLVGNAKPATPAS